MLKRKSEEYQDEGQSHRPAKRQRRGEKTHILHLSDELLLRSLSFLPVESLVRCDRVCQKLRSLSTDDEIWREKYYNQFVRHRARRLPALQTMSFEEREKSALRHSSRRAKWLEHSYLLHGYAKTDWKHVFKVKHNWNRGKARRSEVQIDASPSPVALAKICQGKLYTADLNHGLRVWKKGNVVLSCPLNRTTPPTALAVEVEGINTRMCIGHADGAVQLFMISGTEVVSTREVLPPGGPSVQSVAISFPYMMILSMAASLTLLQSVNDPENAPVRCLAALRGGNTLTSAALSLRKTNTTLIAGVSYAFSRFNTDWCLGLQEIRLDMSGKITCNRTASDISMPVQDSVHSPKMVSFMSRSASTAPFTLHPQLMRAPNSLSYCGCYILAGLPDNTLMVYTVTSTEDKLEIGVGRRLWGHTSAISAAEVTSTGKAISISSKSDEMRYWELEEVLASSSLKKTSTPITSADLDMFNNAIFRQRNGAGQPTKHLSQEEQICRRCVSFDDEQAIVVGARGQRQVIACFDFA